MTKKIKFRAWDKNHNEILYVNDSAHTETLGKMLDNFEDEDLMQFTGLSDKNGKEIYEGDIVKWKYGFQREDKYTISVVGLENGSYFPFCEDYDGHYSVHANESEVLGNIYENPELIK